MAQLYGDTRDLAGVLHDLAARSVSDQARALERYRDLVNDLARGELDADAVRAQYDRLVAEQSAELTRDLTSLGVSYYQRLIEINRAYLDRVFDELGASRRAAPHSSHDDRDHRAAPPIVDLRLRGRVGEVARGSFVIENKRPDTAKVRFLVSDLDSGGREPFRAPLLIDPPRFELGPHTERSVTLALQLDREQFDPGRTYHGEVLVRSNDDLTLRLTIDVDDSSHQHRESEGS